MHCQSHHICVELLTYFACRLLQNIIAHSLVVDFTVQQKFIMQEHQKIGYDYFDLLTFTISFHHLLSLQSKLVM